MKRFAIVAAAASIVLSNAAGAGAESIKGKEIIGLRLGGIFSTMELDDAFGKGSELEVHFIEGIGSFFGIGVALSGHDFGKSQDPDKDIEFTGVTQSIDFMIYSLTACFYAQTGLGGRFVGSGEAGGGLYTSISSIPIGVFTEGKITKNQLGIYCGTGLTYRISKRISVNLNGKYHYLFSGSDYRQPIYAYTGRKTAHFYQIAIGVTLVTGY
jgi:hypothetical protein